MVALNGSSPLAWRRPDDFISAWRGKTGPRAPAHGHPAPGGERRRGCDRLLCQAFGAQQIGERFTGPDGELIHAEIQIGNSVVMVTEDAVDGPVSSPQRLGGMVTCVMAVYWEDVDAAWERAEAAGAEVIYPLQDQFYGERGGRLRDPFGQQWMMSQHIEDVPAEEMARRAAAFFSQ
jgi:PhnB protein